MRSALSVSPRPTSRCSSGRRSGVVENHRAYKQCVLLASEKINAPASHSQRD